MLNRERADEKMAEYGLDVLVATSSANIFYTSDVYPYGSCFAVLPLEREVEPALVAPIGGSTPIVLMSPPWFSDVRYYGEFYVETRFAEEPMTEAERGLIRAQRSWEESKESDPVSLLIGLLKERGFTRGRIGVDESNLRHDNPFWKRLKVEIPDLEAVPARRIFREIRMVKTEEEIRRVKEAARITEEAWDTSLENVHEGMTEKEFAKIFQNELISGGGINSRYLGIYWPPIAFGRRTAFPDVAQPTDYKLRKGDIIRFDGGCTYEGYPCDMARSVVFGKPSEKLEKYWHAIFEGEHLAIGLAEPGVEASTIFDVAVDEVRRRGIGHYARHHTGHGWGIEGYDPPTIGPWDHTPLEEGMVLCFETPYYEVGWGGILHEDVVVVIETGCLYLTRFQGELRILE